VVGRSRRRRYADERGRDAVGEPDQLVALVELDALAVGLGGRDRKAVSNAERARVNVTRAIRGVLKRVAEFDADLGRELESTVRTGTFCAYEPDPRRPVTWTIEEG
jgi:hypothetical protein